MSNPFVGEIRMFAGNFAPSGWAFCDGQLLAVSQNDALFSLYGTIYGGDGRTTFGLPDLRGRVPLHQGTGPGLSPRRLGSKGGTESVTLTTDQIPNHTHPALANGSASNSMTPVNNFPGSVADSQSGYYTPTSNGTDTAFSDSSVANAGNSQAHTNLMPALCINFIVALVGIYPSRS